MKKLVYLLLPMIFVSCGNESQEVEPKKNDSPKAVTEVSDTTVVKTRAIPTPYLGQSAQIVMGTPNFARTVKFYETLGWKEQASQDSPWKWTMLYDGSTILMINEDTMNYMGIGYNATNASDIYEKLEKDGIKPFVSVDNPKTNETWFNVYASPDSMGYSIVNEDIEMLGVENSGSIFSAPTGTKFDFPNAVVGSFQEFAISVEDLDESIAYWENLGFKNNGIKSEPYRYTIAYDGLMVLGLHETKGMWDGNAFTYSGHGIEENQSALATLQANGFAKDVTAFKYGDMVMEGNYLIPDPAGNMFFLTTDLTMLKK